MSVPQNDNHTFVLLTEQLSRMTDELVGQRSSHMQLVNKVSEQNVTLASLAERITAHNRLLEERKAGDHMRLGTVEARLGLLEAEGENSKQWRWKITGAACGVAVLAANFDELVKWIL